MFYKVPGNKKNNIVEPLYDSTTGAYVFEDELISEKLFNTITSKMKNRVKLITTHLKLIQKTNSNQLFKQISLCQRITFFCKNMHKMQ